MKREEEDLWKNEKNPNSFLGEPIKTQHFSVCLQWKVPSTQINMDIFAQASGQNLI